MGLEDITDTLCKNKEGGITRREFNKLAGGLLFYPNSLNSIFSAFAKQAHENKKDYLGICLNEDYARLFKEIDINYTILNLKGNERQIANQVGEYVKLCGKKPFILDFGHYIMAYAMNPEDSVVCFDNHYDDGIDFEPNQNFTSGTFHSFSPAEKIYALGVTDRHYGNKVKGFSPENIKDFFNEDIGKNIFLSFDLDVLDPKYYKVPTYTQSKLSPKDVAWLTERIIKGRNITGINIACYGKEDTHSIPIAKQILKPIFKI